MDFFASFKSTIQNASQICLQTTVYAETSRIASHPTTLGEVIFFFFEFYANAYAYCEPIHHYK